MRLDCSHGLLQGIELGEPNGIGSFGCWQPPWGLQGSALAVEGLYGRQVQPQLRLKLVVV